MDDPGQAGGAAGRPAHNKGPTAHTFTVYDTGTDVGPVGPERLAPPLRRVGSGRRVALVVGEVAEQVLAGRSLGDGVDQQLAADEGALP
jgi:hypothetical protein